MHQQTNSCCWRFYRCIDASLLLCPPWQTTPFTLHLNQSRPQMTLWRYGTLTALRKRWEHILGCNATSRGCFLVLVKEYHWKTSEQIRTSTKVHRCLIEARHLYQAEDMQVGEQAFASLCNGKACETIECFPESGCKYNFCDTWQHTTNNCSSNKQ